MLISFFVFLESLGFLVSSYFEFSSSSEEESGELFLHLSMKLTMDLKH